MKRLDGKVDFVSGSGGSIALTWAGQGARLVINPDADPVQEMLAAAIIVAHTLQSLVHTIFSNDTESGSISVRVFCVRRTCERMTPSAC